MTLAYILGGGLNYQPGIGVDFYEKYERARATYRDVAGWTGFSVPEILQDAVPEDIDMRAGIGAIRQVTAVLAISDVLADHGIRPGAVAGLSLGGLVGAAMVGSVDRADLFRVLMLARQVPAVPEGAKPQSVAVLTLPIDEDHNQFYRLTSRGVFGAADLGAVGAGRQRVVIVGGYRDSIGELIAELPTGFVQRSSAHDAAMHTPLQRHVVEFLKPIIDKMVVRDPLVPLCSCFETKVITTAEDVRSVFRRNPVAPISVPHMRAGLQEAGTELGLVIGPSQFDKYLLSPFPVVHVGTADQVVDAISAIHELGVELPAGQALASNR